MTQRANESIVQPVFRVCAPTEDSPEIHIEVQLLRQEVKKFHTPDLTSLLGALNYNGAFVHARYLAMTAFQDILQHYKDNIWLPEDDYGYRNLISNEEYSTVRREVWDLIRTCCFQEGNLLNAALDVVAKDIMEYLRLTHTEQTPS
jgi:hypothetical protein